MKKWIKNILNLLVFISNFILIIFSFLYNFNILNIYWIIFPSIILFISSILNIYMPNYSLKKILRPFYITDYVGIYEANLKSTTNYKGKIKNFSTKINFEIKIENENIIKYQRNPIHKTNSKSEVISINVKKDKILMIFKYSANDNLYKEKGITNISHYGIEVIEYNIKNKNLESSYYYNRKPSYGIIENIKRNYN